MDFALTEEQGELQQLAGQILDDHSDHERLKKIEATDERFDGELWEKLAEANLLGVTVPEEFGGLGMGLTELGLVCEQVGWTLPRVPALPTFAGLLALVELAPESLASAVVPGLVSGEDLLTVALVEPDAAPAATPATKARPDGDGWVLDGVKICVPYAGLARYVLVSATTGDGRHGLFLVDTDAPGISGVAQEVTSLEPQSVLTLSGVAVAGSCVVSVGNDPDPLSWLLDRMSVLVCAAALGVADRSLHIAAEYTRTRYQFDVPVGSFQAVHTRLADSYIDVTAMRLTTWQAMWRLDQDLDATDELDIAKFWASDAAYNVARAAVHLHGGIGVDVDYPLHRYYLWAKTLELTLGSATPRLAEIGTRMAAAPSTWAD